jgi:type IV pilus assembly protein PilQ
MAAGSSDHRTSCWETRPGTRKQSNDLLWLDIRIRDNHATRDIRSEMMKKNYLRNIGNLLVAAGCFLAAVAAEAQTSLETIGFVALPGTRFEIELGFNGRPPEPEAFMIESPARLTMDFSNVSSNLEDRRFPLNFDNADSVMILEAQGRTRMVVNLNSPAPYTTRTQGNSLFIVIGDEQARAATTTAAAPQAGAGQSRPFAPPAVSGPDIRGIDFRRTGDGAGQIIIDLARPGLNANINQAGSRLEIEFPNAEISQGDQMRLDVTDYPTPVQFVTLYSQNDNVMVLAEMTGQYEYLAYQSDNQYIVNVTPVASGAGQGLSSGIGGGTFTGERISLNFQTIEIRTALQILADFNDFSLVVGDNVTGSLTLRLKNVPWDQALDMVLRPRGLDKRLNGNVMYVAPADEIAQAELLALESSQQVESLAPLVTEYIEINYAVASDLLRLLQGQANGTAGAAGGAGAAAAGGAVGGTTNGGILSSRGRASVDTRTNTLIIQDVESVLEDVRSLVARLDVPVRQVLIEARIVNASTSFSHSLGVKWGGAQTFPGAGDRFILSGSQASSIEFGNNLSDYYNSINSAVAGGATLEEALALAPVVSGPSFPDALAVDLGVASPNSSIALGFAGNNGLLELELSALEASGNGEVIAQPKVTTQDQQPAQIQSGLQIPYQAQAGGTAGGSTTEFITAALSLDVTPQITPDGRIIMLLDIHQDSVVPGSGAVPAISTNSVTTRVLVNDGETVVLGGVFREETTTTISKTPLLGDLPYIGNAFKKTEDSETKTELLIFITPSIINEVL